MVINFNVQIFLNYNKERKAPLICYLNFYISKSLTLFLMRNAFRSTFIASIKIWKKRRAFESYILAHQELIFPL